MNDMNIIAPLLIAMAGIEPKPQVVAVTHHKPRVKWQAVKAQRTGKGKPAKGYDPETKTWSKP
jgi:hypothetical protein